MATEQEDCIEVQGRTHERPAGGDLKAALARAVVAIHRRHLGRGPTKVQAFFRQNVVVVVLTEVMTTPEHTLVAAGRTELVADVRRQLQVTMHDDLVLAVETLTGCRVSALMGDIDVAADTSAEVFVLDRPIEPAQPADRAG